MGSRERKRPIALTGRPFVLEIWWIVVIFTVMKTIKLILSLAAVLSVLAGCSKTEVDIEELASKGIWYNESRNEILYIDRNNSTFIVQGATWADDPPVHMWKNGRPCPMHYTKENGKFIFGEGDSVFYSSYVWKFDEAYFSSSNELVVTIRSGKMLKDGEFKPISNTWQGVYILMDPSIFIN